MNDVIERSIVLLLPISIRSRLRSVAKIAAYTETQKYVFTNKHTNQRNRYIQIDRIDSILVTNTIFDASLVD